MTKEHKTAILAMNGKAAHPRLQLVVVHLSGALRIKNVEGLHGASNSIKCASVCVQTYANTPLQLMYVYTFLYHYLL